MRSIRFQLVVRLQSVATAVDMIQSPVRCFLALLVVEVAVADPPIYSPIPQGVKYAGPIVYSNSAPPIITFPPPPQGASVGWGSGQKAIKYVPIPHHDLPVLIYQSDSNPPIHVVSPPTSSLEESGHSILSDRIEYGPPKIYHGSPKSEFDSPQTLSTFYGPPNNFDNSRSSSTEWLPGPASSHSNSFGNDWDQAPPPTSKPAPHIIYRGHPPIHVLHQARESSPKFSPWVSGPPSSGWSHSEPSVSYGPQTRESGSPLSSFYRPSRPTSYRSSKTITISFGQPKAYPRPLSGPFGSYHGPPLSAGSEVRRSYETSSSEPFHSSPSTFSYLSHDAPITSSFYGPPAKGGFLSSMLKSFAPKPTISYGPPKDYHGESSFSYGSPKKTQSRYLLAPTAWHKPPVIVFIASKGQTPVTVYKRPDAEGWDSSSQATTNHGNVFSSDINDVSSDAEVFLPSASAQRPNIIKPPVQPMTIYVAKSSAASQGTQGPFKTFLVSSDPLQVQQVGYRSPLTGTKNVTPESSFKDLDAAASSVYSMSSSNHPTVTKAEVIHEHVAQSAIFPSNTDTLLKQYKNDDTHSEESASVSVPLSLIVETSTESSEK